MGRLSAIADADRSIETPMQELVEVSQGVLACSRDTALKVWGILGTMGAGVGMYLDDGQINVFLLGFAAGLNISKYNDRVDLKDKDSDVLDKKILTRFQSVFAILPFSAVVALKHPDLLMWALNICTYYYMCDRYHDTGSRMRDGVKSKIDMLLRKYRKVDKPA